MLPAARVTFLGKPMGDHPLHTPVPSLKSPLNPIATAESEKHPISLELPCFQKFTGISRGARPKPEPSLSKAAAIPRRMALPSPVRPSEKS